MTRLHQIGVQQGHVLLAALMLIILLALLSLSLLHVAGQDAPGISAMRDQTQAQHLAEGAVDLIVSWFHQPAAAPPSLAGALMKRQDAGQGPSFFDAAGRSQFVGTAERPDVLLDASSDSGADILNGSAGAFSGVLSEVGRLDRVKIYGPTQPGLLGTVEVTTSTRGQRPFINTVKLQLAALNIPPLRAAIQTGQGLGIGSGASGILAHWGDFRVMGDLIVNRNSDLIVKSPDASITGQSYETLRIREDRWVNYWIGGHVSVLSPSGNESAGFPGNVHVHQQPTPGVALDRWDYDFLRRTSQRHGSYYRLGRDGRLRAAGTAESDPGFSPADVLASSAVGQSQGLVFIDTVDGEAPRMDNLGTLVLDTDYVEALLVVQGHLVIKPSGPGRSLTVLSPAPEGSNALGGRVPVTLTGIHLRGLLYAAGTITVDRETRIYGALLTAGTVATGSSGQLLEVWYDSDFGKGFFRGLPVVYRAPATWQVKY
jgi:Tfp pilus assembly protein PilX